MERKISNYLTRQIKLEEKYYDQLYEIISGLVIWLNDFIESKHNITLLRLTDVYNEFYKNNIRKLYQLNQIHAIEITQLAFDAYNNSSTTSLPVDALKPHYIKHLTVGLNIKLNNLLDTIKGRYIALIPLGVTLVDYLLFTDENTKEALIIRCNLSLSRYAQSTTTEGVFNTIIYEAEEGGATEYLPDNQHDDRVRETHKKYFNGQTWIPFNNPPPCGHVGTEGGCRCIILEVR